MCGTTIILPMSCLNCRPGYLHPNLGLRGYSRSPGRKCGGMSFTNQGILEAGASAAGEHGSGGASFFFCYGDPGASKTYIR